MYIVEMLQTNTNSKSFKDNSSGLTTENCNYILLFIVVFFVAPVLSCDAPVSSSGVITVTWSYVHNGGLPLTNVSVFYTFMEGSTINHVPANVSDIHTSSVSIHHLVTGFKYTFNITARNSNGASSILCGPILHDVGEYV